MTEEQRTCMSSEIGLPPLMSIREIQGHGVKKLKPSSPIMRSPRKKSKQQFPDHISEQELPRVFSQTLGTGTKHQRSESERLLYRHDDQLAEAQRTTTILDEQVKALRHENGDMKEFLRDILYTLNARGYESITDNRGGIIDLNRCQGEHFLDLKGRDVRGKQIPIKRIQAQEHLLKAYIGSQEKLIRNLVNQIHNKANEAIGGQLSSPSFRMRGYGNDAEVEKSAILEKEILAMVNSLTSTIERHPYIYTALNEQLFFESTCSSGESNGILATVLSRHQHLMTNDYHSQSSSSVPRKSEPSRNISTSTTTTASVRRKPSYFLDLKRSSDYAHLEGKSLSVVSALREKFRQQRPLSPGHLMKTLSQTEENDRRHEGGGILRPVGKPVSGKNPLGSAASINNLRGDGGSALGRHRRPSTSINEYSSQKTQTTRCWAL